MRLDADEYKNIVAKGVWSNTEHVVWEVVNVYVQPKERPRTGANGHVYTPKKTQDCERKIAAAFEDYSPVYYPVKIEIDIYVEAPKWWHKIPADARQWTSPRVGDLDNRIKTVTDALNGIIYKDDVQIRELQATQKYAAVSSVTVRMYRAGLSKNELDQLAKFITLA